MIEGTCALARLQSSNRKQTQFIGGKKNETQVHLSKWNQFFCSSARKWFSCLMELYRVHSKSWNRLQHIWTISDSIKSFRICYNSKREKHQFLAYSQWLKVFCYCFCFLFRNHNSNAYTINFDEFVFDPEEIAAQQKLKSNSY